MEGRSQQAEGRAAGHIRPQCGVEADAGLKRWKL